jgi:hypothetical protein
MSFDNGTLKINDQNCGIYLMEDTLKESILEYFPLVIGPKWMSGIISNERKLKFPPYTTHIQEKLCGGVTPGYPIPNF